MGDAIRGLGKARSGEVVGKQRRGIRKGVDIKGEGGIGVAVIAGILG